jgi:hypothetical protein
MSTTSGVFSETQLLDIRIKAEQLGLDSRIGLQYKANVNTILALQAAQTARIIPLERKDKDHEVEIEWINACGIEVGDNVSCVVGGEELSTNTEKHALDIEKVVNFTVDDSAFINNDFGREEAIAKGFMRADKVLSEYLAQTAVAKLESFKGVNQLTGGKGTVSGLETYILPSSWDATLMAYLSRASVVNQFGVPILLSGQNLYEAFMIAQAKIGNDNGKGDVSLFSGMRMYFDLFNVDSVNDPDLKTYMINTGAIAMASKTYYTPSIVTYSAEKRWSISSAHIPGLEFDVHYKDECGTNDFYKHHFKIKLKSGIFQNPLGCNAENTGVLSFICGVPSL